MILAHPITGLTITQLTKRFLGDFNKRQEKVVWFVGITSAVLPDFDLIIAFLLKRDSHHHFITHTPIFYLVIALISAIALLIWEIKIKKIFSNEKRISVKTITLEKDFKKIAFIEKLIIIFLANTIVHILMDIPAGKLHPLWPMYDETISLIKLDSNENWFETYINSPAIFLEAFWFIIGITLTIKNRKLENAKFTRLLIFIWTIIAIFSTIFLINY